MTAFGGLILTNDGKELQSKAQTGKPIKYTRVVVGDGELGTNEIVQLNTLIKEVKSLDIQKLKTYNDGRAVVGSILSNQNLTDGFYFREIGVFADDPDAGEIMYCYANSCDLAEYIPPKGTDIIEKTIDVQMIVGNAENVSASIDESLVYVTQAEFNQHKDDKNNPHGISLEQIGAMPVGPLTWNQLEGIE